MGNIILPMVKTFNFIKDLEGNIYCRLRPSSVEGVGVFAIRDIPKGTNPFQGCREVTGGSIPLRELMTQKTISEEVKQLVKDLYVVENGMVFFPHHSLNDVDIGFFVNHSDTPNLEVLKGGEEFIANRDIEKGEELFADYGTYGDRQNKF